MMFIITYKSKHKDHQKLDLRQRVKWSFTFIQTGHSVHKINIILYPLSGQTLFIYTAIRFQNPDKG